MIKVKKKKKKKLKHYQRRHVLFLQRAFVNVSYGLGLRPHRDGRNAKNRQEETQVQRKRKGQALKLAEVTGPSREPKPQVCEVTGAVGGSGRHDPLH